MLLFHFVVVMAIVAVTATIARASTCAVQDSSKRDCGYGGIDQSSCESKGCCWAPAGQNSVTPWCYYSEASSTGYTLVDVEQTDCGFTGYLNLNSGGTSSFGPDLTKLKLEVMYEAKETVRIKVSDANSVRWEVPQSVINRKTCVSRPSVVDYSVSYTANPFTFEVMRHDGVSLFKTTTPFVFKDQYIELQTEISPSAKTFGIGESTRTNHALKTGQTYTLWAADIPALSMNDNLYGSFPYYLQMLNGKAHGAMLVNSNGMDVRLESNTLTFKAIGGIIDLYVFSGSSPAEVVKQYTNTVGHPTMFPYWSLGFHNCKYGYTSVYQVEQVVANYSAANIPLDTQWMDIDYMQNYRDFSYDSVNFPTSEVKKFVDGLHANGQHFVPIIDPGIMVYPGYDAYEKGLKADIFIKDITGGNYLGQVWPGPTYFPDFLNPATQNYWTEQLQGFYNMVPVDGLWIDMNEASNFCNSDGQGQYCSIPSSGCPAPGASQTDCCLTCSTWDYGNKYEYPPYNIANKYGKLSTKTIAVSAKHYNNITNYDAHNLYGITEQIATNAAMVSIRSKRPFVLSRSSFLSTGVHSAKWTGDNGATFDDLKSSIVSIMDFNIFGVPMIGADICGFIWDTTEELCARWIEVGAFYPFSRNHNAIGQKPQELYLWSSVAEASRKALGMRYQLLPYSYTLFYNAYNSGETVARALWINFPEDSNAVNIDRQFMVGPAILVSPVLDQGVTSVNAYFPQGLWYSFADRKIDVDASLSSLYKSIYTPLTSINVHVKGGSVVPLQDAAMTTTLARQTPFTLLTALCPGGKAFGDLFFDDGEQVEIKEYLHVTYISETSSAGGSFTSTVNNDSYSAASKSVVGSIVVMGTSSLIPAQALASATLNGKVLSSSQIVVDSASSRVSFVNLNIPVNQGVRLVWNY